MKIFYLCSFFIASLAAVVANSTQLIPLKETIPDEIGSAYMANLTRKSIKSRILYGYRATPRQFPYATWLNLLVDQKIEHCGGSLISRNFVLSAARCVQSSQLRGIDVYLGSIDMTAFPFKTSADAFIAHEAYNPQTNLNDISLIRMRLFVMNPVAKLPTRDTKSWVRGAEVLVDLLVAGWGLTENGVVSQYLLYTPEMDLSVWGCGISFTYSTPLICAMGLWPISSAAPGDVGGPMELYGLLFGITSFVTDEGRNGFTRIDHFLDWISYYTGIQVE